MIVIIVNYYHHDYELWLWWLWIIIFPAARQAALPVLQTTHLQQQVSTYMCHLYISPFNMKIINIFDQKDVIWLFILCDMIISTSVANTMWYDHQSQNRWYILMIISHQSDFTIFRITVQALMQYKYKCKCKHRHRHKYKCKYRCKYIYANTNFQIFRIAPTRPSYCVHLSPTATRYSLKKCLLSQVLGLKKSKFFNIWNVTLQHLECFLNKFNA